MGLHRIGAARGDQGATHVGSVSIFHSASDPLRTSEKPARRGLAYRRLSIAVTVSSNAVPI
jgi:hypothetical protein